MSLPDELASLEPAARLGFSACADVRVDPMGFAAKLAIVSAARSLPVLSDLEAPS